MFKLIFEGTKDGIDEKLKSPFWGSIVLTWLTWNRKIWYITFFVSEKYTGNKILYIKEIYEYSNTNIYGFKLFPYLGFLINWIIMPLFLSWLIIWFITPKISHKFLKKHTINKENEIEIIEINTKLLNAERKNIEAEMKKRSAELENDIKLKELEYKKQQEQLKKSLDDAKRKAENQTNIYSDWDEEYKVLNKKYPNLNSELNKLIYKYKGQINNDNWTRQINEETEKILDSNGIIKYIEKEIYDGRVYDITEKGKYFLKKSTLE